MAVEYPLQVEYCGLCGLPPEYCEYGSDIDKCRAWLKDNLPDLYSDLVAGVEGLEIGDGKEEKKRQTRGGKATKIAKKKSAAEQKVVIRKETRSKKKCVTIITGMATFEIDPKKAAKAFASKFSCGSSVSAPDEIVIQGDVADDLWDFIPEKWPQIDEDSIDDKT